MIHNKSNSNNQSRRGKPSTLLIFAGLSLLGQVSCSNVGDITITAIDAISIIHENNNRHLQTQTPRISEAYHCIPAQEIQRIHQSSDDRLPWANGVSGAIQKECYLEQNSCGSETARSACCRVSFEAGWLVCDAFNAFDFMPCVCNDNTDRTRPTAEPTTVAPTEPVVPTVSPTAAPTVSPTVSPPTASPTVSPTAFPTVSPTHEPTAKVVPTLDPTGSPTANPTSSPTKAPVTVSPTQSPTAFPTAVPTAVPTRAPTAMPTQFPTKSLGYTTEDKFDADISSMIRQSQCKEDPPVVQFLQASTFVYRYEVTVLEDSAQGVLLNDLWKEGIHDELAREFLICDGYEFDTVWILQSKPHQVDESTPCQSSGEDSNDSLACLSMVAEARFIAYKSPLGERTTKQAWTGSTYQEGETAEKFALDAIAFLDDRLNSGDGGLGFAPSFGISFQGGELLLSDDSTEENNNNGESSGEGDGESNGDSNGNTDEETSDSVETGDGDLTNADGPWADEPGGTAIGAQASQGNNDSNAKGRLTPAMIATIAAVASCVVLIIVLGAVARNRRNSRESREDEEYLQDMDTPKSDSKYYSTHPVDHLDLSDSTDSSGPTDVERNATSPGPYRDSNRSRMLRSPKSPLAFNFSGFSGIQKSMSPTSRERTKMGPLGLADKLRQQNSGSERTESSTTGTYRGGIPSNSSSVSSTNHRGIPSTSSSMSSTNHRGIVINSSSMSSNNNASTTDFPPPPHQNSSPRLYNLQDTVKL